MFLEGLIRVRRSSLPASAALGPPRNQATPERGPGCLWAPHPLPSFSNLLPQAHTSDNRGPTEKIPTRPGTLARQSEYTSLFRRPVGPTPWNSSVRDAFLQLLTPAPNYKRRLPSATDSHPDLPAPVPTPGQKCCAPESSAILEHQGLIFLPDSRGRVESDRSVDLVRYRGPRKKSEPCLLVVPVLAVAAQRARWVAILPSILRAA